MADDALREVVEFLERAAAEVRRLEAEGEAVIKTEGQTAFRAVMERKAGLLADLPNKAAPLTAKVGGEVGRSIDKQLARFSTSAATSLRIGSVFFMTALLYPEEHKPGGPNDLEAYVAELRGKL